jgi:hypothetical protein
MPSLITISNSVTGPSKLSEKTERVLGQFYRGHAGVSRREEMFACLT